MCPTRTTLAQAAYSLVELMVASAIAGLVVLAACGFAFYAAHPYSALANYSDLDEKGQLALDKFTQQSSAFIGVSDAPAPPRRSAAAPRAWALSLPTRSR